MVKTWFFSGCGKASRIGDPWIDDHPPIFWGNQHVFWRRDTYDSLRFKFWNIHDFPKKPEWFITGRFHISWNSSLIHLTYQFVVTIHQRKRTSPLTQDFLDISGIFILYFLIFFVTLLLGGRWFLRPISIHAPKFSQSPYYSKPS